MIIIHAQNAKSAESTVRRTNRTLRHRFNTYGLKRIDSGKTADGFAIAVEIPQLWDLWSQRHLTETDLLQWFREDRWTLEILVH